LGPARRARLTPATEPRGTSKSPTEPGGGYKLGYKGCPQGLLTHRATRRSVAGESGLWTGPMGSATVLPSL